MIRDDIQRLRKFLANNEVDKIFDEVFPALEGVETDLTSIFLSISASYKSLENEQLRGLISNEDKDIEFNKIIFRLDKSIERLSNLDPEKLNTKRSQEVVMEDIAKLSEDFFSLESMKSKLSRIRMRVTIAREIADKLIMWPNLMDHYKDTDNVAIICGIGRKVKLIPDIDDLKILENQAKKVEDDFVKQFIVNAMAELIIAGQLRAGDDEVMHKMLKKMKKGADKLLEENIERVQAMVDFVNKELRDDVTMQEAQQKKE